MIVKNWIVIFFALIIYLLSADTDAGEVYKWVDENGKVHYSDRPKDDKAQVVEIKDKITPEQQREAQAQADKLIRLQRRRVSIELENAYEKKKEQHEAKQKAAELNKACTDARNAVRILEYQAPVMKDDGKGGGQFIGDEERKMELQRLRAAIAKHCSK